LEKAMMVSSLPPGNPTYHEVAYRIGGQRILRCFWALSARTEHVKVPVGTRFTKPTATTGMCQDFLKFQPKRRDLEEGIFADYTAVPRTRTLAKLWRTIGVVGEIVTVVGILALLPKVVDALGIAALGKTISLGGLTLDIDTLLTWGIGVSGVGATLITVAGYQEQTAARDDPDNYNRGLPLADPYIGDRYTGSWIDNGNEVEETVGEPYKCP
jgi:hypothetical protein